MSVAVRRLEDKASTIPTTELILVNEDKGAALLGVSKPTFRAWAAQGLVRPVSLPGNIRRRLYRRVDLEEFAARLAADAR